MDFLTNWIFELLYSLQKTICYIIDFIRQIFYMLCGIKPVNINGESTDKNEGINDTQYFFSFFYNFNFTFHDIYLNLYKNRFT